MPKQSGLIKIKGTMGDISFYKSNGEYFARQKGGIDGDRIANDPAFVRTRENGKEFATSASAGKLLRNVIRPMMLNATDPRAVSRLAKIMSLIKNLDSGSVRGERNVGAGLTDPKSKVFLKGFDFNSAASLSSILKKGYTVGTGTGNIDISSLVPLNDLVAPSGATHVSFKGGWAKIDFVNGSGELVESNVVSLAIDPTVNSVKLSPAGVPAGTGLNLFLLKMEFFQEINGLQYSLRNGAFNALSIIEVL